MKTNNEQKLIGTDYNSRHRRQTDNTLHQAASGNSDQIISVLIKTFKNNPAALKAFIQTQNKDGETALHTAAFWGHAQVIPALLKPFEADPAALKAFIKTQDKDGDTALHRAAVNGNDQGIPALLQPFEADPAALKAFVQTKNQHGETALDDATNFPQWISAQIISALLKPFERDPAALKAFIKTQRKDGKTALDVANQRGHADTAKTLSSYARQKREISKASEELVERVDEKSFPSLIQDSVATATDHAEIPEPSPIATHDQKQPLIDAIAAAEACVASSAGKPTSWMGDLWVWGKKLMVGSYSKPESLDLLEASLPSKPPVCSDPLNTSTLPVGPTAGPTLLEMGDQWVKNSDTNGLLTWGTLLARKWTGYRPKAFPVPSYDPATEVALSIQSYELVDAFMDKVEEQVQACGMEKATSAIFENSKWYTQAIETVRKKIATGQLHAITTPLFEQVAQQNSSKIASTATSKQADQLLANLRDALPKLEQQFLQQAVPLQNPCQEAKLAHTTAKPTISLLNQAMCSMQPTDQLADTSLPIMGHTNHRQNALVQDRLDHGNPYIRLYRNEGTR